ncbi:MAG: hypothetical protein ACI9EF_003113 [Pseudohongiellaceae bacterium]
MRASGASLATTTRTTGPSFSLARLCSGRELAAVTVVAIARGPLTNKHGLDAGKTAASGLAVLSVEGQQPFVIHELAGGIDEDAFVRVKNVFSEQAIEF